MKQYEYGIAFKPHFPDVHRKGMTEEEAKTWIEEYYALAARHRDGPRFTVIRRELGPWQSVDDSDTL